MPVAPKVLINALSAQKGGGQTYLINLLDYPALREDLDVTLVVSSSNLSKFEKLPNVKLLLAKFGGQNLITRFFWENFYLPLLLKKKSIDLLFSVSGILPKFYLPSTCKSVTICQNMLPFCSEELARLKSKKFKLKFLLIKYSQWISFFRSDLIIFISDFGKSVITGLPLLKRKKNTVIPHGIPDFFRNHSASKPNTKSDFKYTMYVSSFFEYKAQMELVLAWAALPTEIRAGRKLLLVGPEGTGYREQVRKKVTDLGLQGEVEIVGELKYLDLPDYYCSAELLVFASSCENCPNILLEGLAAGVLTICSNYPPMPEFAKDSVVYVDPYNVGEVRNTLVKFYSGGFNNQVYIRKALELSKSFTWQRTALETWSSFRSILA